MHIWSHLSGQGLRRDCAKKGRYWGARGRLVPEKMTNGQPTFLANRFDNQKVKDASRQLVFV